MFFWLFVVLSAAGADKPRVVELWPGKAPDEAGNIGPEKIRMSPTLTKKEVEVPSSTKMLTNVTKPTLTIYRPAKDKDSRTAVLICPGGGYWDLYGGTDIISPPEHSVLMYLALKRAGIPAELHIYAGAAHDFAVRKVDHPCSAWTERCIDWLRNQGFLERAKAEP